MPDCDIFNHCFAAIIALPGLNLKKKSELSKTLGKRVIYLKSVQVIINSHPPMKKKKKKKTDLKRPLLDYAFSNLLVRRCSNIFKYITTLLKRKIHIF